MQLGPDSCVYYHLFGYVKSIIQEMHLKRRGIQKKCFCVIFNYTEINFQYLHSALSYTLSRSSVNRLSKINYNLLIK